MKQAEKGVAECGLLPQQYDLTNSKYFHKFVCIGNLFAGVGGYEVLFPAAVQVCIDRGGRLATNAEAQADIVNNLHESGVGCGCFWVAEEEVHYLSDCDPNKYWDCPLHPSGWGSSDPGWNALCYGKPITLFELHEISN